MVQRRIAVIDDSTEFVETVAEALTDAGYDVEGRSGEDVTVDAVAALSPDLVLLDLVLRGSDELTGWELLNAMRAHPELESVPVVVTSADQQQLRTRADELGGIGHAHILPKPFGIDQLEGVVRRALRERAREAS